jgi:hypothetical protein
MVELQARLARRRTEGAERLRRRRSRNREVHRTQHHARVPARPRLAAEAGRTPGLAQKATGRVFSWLMNIDSAYTGVPSRWMAG